MSSWVVVGLLISLTGFGAADTTADRAANPDTVHFQFREPRRAGYLVERPTAGALRLQAASGPQWLAARPDNGSTNRVEFGDRVALRLSQKDAWPGLLQGRPLTVARALGGNAFILQAPDSWTALEQAQELA